MSHKCVYFSVHYFDSPHKRCISVGRLPHCVVNIQNKSGFFKLPKVITNQGSESQTLSGKKVSCGSVTLIVRISSPRRSWLEWTYGQIFLLFQRLSWQNKMLHNKIRIYKVNSELPIFDYLTQLTVDYGKIKRMHCLTHSFSQLHRYGGLNKLWYEKYNLIRPFYLFIF